MASLLPKMSALRFVRRHLGGHAVVEALLAGLTPLGGYLAVLLALAVVVGMPMPGRGPGIMRRRDPWRLFKYGARREVLDRAGHRCEAPLFIAWGRCHEHATEADHVYPWSKGGQTIVSNGQALCKDHNRRKSNLTPPWWYLRGLERRRRGYFESAAEVRVSARMSRSDSTARTRLRSGTSLGPSPENYEGSTLNAQR